MEESKLLVEYYEKQMEQLRQKIRSLNSELHLFKLRQQKSNIDHLVEGPDDKFMKNFDCNSLPPRENTFLNAIQNFINHNQLKMTTYETSWSLHYRTCYR